MEATPDKPIYMSHEEFMALKIADYETIPYSVTLDCPNGCLIIDRRNRANLVGWCETPRGYMMVDECRVCFEKYRYHGTTTARSFLDKFEHQFAEQYWLRKQLKEWSGNTKRTL